MRRTAILAAGCAATLAVLLWSAGPSHPGSIGAEPVPFEYDVLSAVQPSAVQPGVFDAASVPVGVLSLTCGWHGGRGCYSDSGTDALDVKRSSTLAGDPVYAAVRSVRHKLGITAYVVSLERTSTGCQVVEVAIVEGDAELARVKYWHTVPSVMKHDTLPIIAASGNIAISKVGTVANPSWQGVARDSALWIHVRREVPTGSKQWTTFGGEQVFVYRLTDLRVLRHKAAVVASGFRARSGVEASDPLLACP